APFGGYNQYATGVAASCRKVVNALIDAEGASGWFIELEHGLLAHTQTGMSEHNQVITRRRVWLTWVALVTILLLIQLDDICLLVKRDGRLTSDRWANIQCVVSYN